MTGRPSIIVHSDKPEPALAVLAESHPDLQVAACDSYGGLAEMIADTGAAIVYSVRFSGTPLFPRRALLESPTVRWVSVGGSGTDHLLPWDPSKITVTNAAGVAAPLATALATNTHFRNIQVNLDPPVASCGAFALAAGSF